MQNTTKKISNTGVSNNGVRVKLSEGCDHWFESRSLLNSLHTPTAKYKITRVAPGLLFVPGSLLNSLTSAGPEFLTIQEEQRKEEQANHCSSSLAYRHAAAGLFVLYCRGRLSTSGNIHIFTKAELLLRTMYVR